MLRARAGGRGLAFVNARLIPVSGPEIEDGTLVVRDGLIEAVGASAAVAVPVDARVRDMSGKVIMPGLVDTHTHIGAAAGADGSAPIQPDVRVLDAIDVRDAGFQRAQAGGLTTRQHHAGLGAPALRADRVPEAARRQHDRGPLDPRRRRRASPAA